LEVIYSTASRIGGIGLANVAYHSVHAIYREGYLKKAITYGNRQDTIPSPKIKVVWFQPTKIFSSLSSRYYYTMKKMWLDWISARFIHRNRCDIFHGWSTECLHSIQEAKRWGAITVVERGYCHPLYSKEILDEEYERWGIRIPAANRLLRRFDSQRREESVALEEFDLADYIFVPSPFAKETFLKHGFPEDKLVVIPRGVDLQYYKPLAEGRELSLFRVVFVGALNIRKGVPYLLEAWKMLKLKEAELVLVGTVHDEIKPQLAHYSDIGNIRVEGFVKDPVKLYQSSSVFVFPTLAEGSAKVTYEAMASGIPVITTPNAGSLVTDGIDGFIVPIRDVEALKERILFFYHHRDMWIEMGAMARKNIEPYTWDRYENSLIGKYKELWERR